VVFERRSEQGLQRVPLPLSGKAVRGDDPGDEQRDEQEERNPDDLDGKDRHLLDVRVSGQALEVGGGHAGEHGLDLVEIVEKERHVKIDEQNECADHDRGKKQEDPEDVEITPDLPPFLCCDGPGLLQSLAPPGLRSLCRPLTGSCLSLAARAPFRGSARDKQPPGSHLRSAPIRWPHPG